MSRELIATTRLNSILHLRYKPNRASFCNCAEPPAFDCFDWVIWSPDDRLFQRRLVERPKTILCLATRQSLEALLARTEKIRGATLVVAGEDTHLSTLLDAMDTLVPYCKVVFYEAKDVRHEQIRSFCMGSISYYINRFDSLLLAREMMKAKYQAAKKRGILVAWGAIWRHLDELVEDRRNACIFVEKTPWLCRENLSPDLYAKRLSESKYLLAPAGNGIQAPKLAEAWLMRVVPVVVINPCFEDLRDEGFPFLMLKRWEDLTETLLEEYENTRLKVDWERVQYMLTLDYFLERISVSKHH